MLLLNKFLLPFKTPRSLTLLYRYKAVHPYNEEDTILLTIGRLILACAHCGAKRYKNESVSGCCLNGKVDLPRREDIPDNLKELFKDPDFKRNIRKYNQGLAFTSTGANVDNALANQRVGTYTYRIQGELVHQMGSYFGEAAWIATKFVF